MRRRAMVAVVLVAGLAVGACSSGASTSPIGSNGGQAAGTSATGGAGTGGSTGSTRPAVVRPDGPKADLSEELTAGKGVFLASVASGPKLEDNGYVEHEYVAKGTATSYSAAGPLPTDGRFQLSPGPSSADYRTRIVVRRPSSPQKFNGTVVMEWLNVSGGLDANPDWAYAADELVRGGYAWVGVSAQKIGVEGGPVAVAIPGLAGALSGKGLKVLDPERYGSLSHPGDAYAYDLFTQVERALRADGSGGALGDLKPARILAAGESQSAFTLTTYVDGVQPLTKAFDGFLVHSRGGAAAPLGTPGGSTDIASAITGQPTTIRTDTDVPVLMLETETDVASIIGYYPARQDDTDRIRLWEVAGTAHVDEYMLGPLSDQLGCGVHINAGPHHFLVKSALHHLDQWVRTGEAPPKAPRLEVKEQDGKPVIQRDADGLALGGIRTPQVDAPVAVVSGNPGPSPSVICLLLGSTVPIPQARLVEKYQDRAGYQAAYTKAADAAVAAGFVLDADRQALLADAHPDQLPG